MTKAEALKLRSHNVHRHNRHVFQIIIITVHDNDDHYNPTSPSSCSLAFSCSSFPKISIWTKIILKISTFFGQKILQMSTWKENKKNQCLYRK